MTTPSTPSTSPAHPGPSDLPEAGSLVSPTSGSAGRSVPTADGSGEQPADGSGEQPADGSGEQAPPRSRYSMGTLPNMLRSLLVIGALVLALVAIVPRISSVQRTAVDASAKAGQVAAQTSWPVELPQGLGDGWVPTVATYAAGTEKVPTFTTVWTTPSGGDIALKQAVKVTDGWLKRSVNDGVPSGSANVAGRTVDRYLSDSAGQVSYVVRGTGADDLTIVATTTAPEAELKAFVAALRRVSPTR
ncbi:hypothetical protein GCM10027053_53960 [Intrasporangium mesophilum]